MTSVSKHARKVRFAVALVTLAALAAYAAPRLLQSHRLRQAELALRARDTAAAEEWLDAALHADPESGEVHFLLARLARRQGRLDVVHEELTRAHRLGVPQERIRREEWLALAQSGQMREAEPHLTDLLLTAGDDTPEVCEAFVNGYVRTRNYGRAVPILDAWEGDYPDDPQPHLFRGAYFQGVQRWADAADAYAQAVERDPDRVENRIRLAHALAKAHRFDESLRHYEICVASHPDDPRVLLGLAECEYGRGEIESARGWFEDVLRIDPADYDARFGLARIDSGAGEYERASPVLAELVEEDPSRTDVLYAYAISLRMTERPDEAAERFAEVERMEALILRVDALQAQSLQQPQSVEIRYELGAALLELRLHQAGEQCLLSVLDDDPHHAGARSLLAGHFAETGRPELAARYRDGTEPAE